MRRRNATVLALSRRPLLIIFVAAPIAKGIGDRLARPAPDKDAIRTLRQELEDAQRRILAGEERIASLEERVDFYEKLLDSPEKVRAARSRLPPG